MPDDSEERRDVRGPVPAGGGRRPSPSSLLVGAVGLAVAVAAVALGLTLSRSDPGVRQASCGPTAPKLSVVGTGQATVTPDLLTVVVQVDAGGPSAAAALATDNADAARALSTFEGGGVQAKDIATSGLSLQPQYEYPKGVPTLTGYEVDNTVTATLRDISKSGAIIDAVVGSAGNALQIAPVSDWSSDFDVLDPRYVADPFGIWDDLRTTCPIAHTDRRGSTWLPTRYEDVTAIAHDIEHFSSLKVAVIPGFRGRGARTRFDGNLEYGLPPISADPPLHTWTRRLLLPWFSHQRVESYVPLTRELCRGLLDGFVDTGHADAAADYAQQIPVRVIAHILGVSPDLSDTFTGWVRDVLEFADDPERRQRGAEGLLEYFIAQVEHAPQAEPGRRPAERAAADRGRRRARSRTASCSGWPPSS
jgi:hypothetical protein